MDQVKQLTEQLIREFGGSVSYDGENDLKFREELLAKAHNVFGRLIDFKNDGEELKKYNRELDHFLKKRQDLYEREANNMSDEALVQSLPFILNKYLDTVSTLWRERDDRCGVLDLQFHGGRQQVRALWALCQCTLNTYGKSKEIEDGKRNNFLPAMRYIKWDLEEGNPKESLASPQEDSSPQKVEECCDDPSSCQSCCSDVSEKKDEGEKMNSNDYIRLAFPGLALTRDFCIDRIPVVVKINSDEKTSGLDPILVTFVHKMFDHPVTYDASEMFVPDFVVKRLVEEGGPKNVRMHLAELSIIDASAKSGIDLTANQEIRDAMASYIENNTPHQVELSIKDQKKDENDSAIEIENLRVTILFPDYPN